MAFKETPRFPDGIALGAVGGPTWLTRIASTIGGDEMRNAQWSQTRHRFSIALAPMNDTDRDVVISFVRAVAAGRLNGFRFKHWADYEASYTDSAAGLGVCTLVSAGVYQLYKRYTSGSNTVDRIIEKPIAATVGIKQGAALLTSGVDYTLDATTGRVTVLGSPLPAPTIWEGEFDVPVRLEADQAALRTLIAGVTDWPSLDLIEIRP